VIRLLLLACALLLSAVAPADPTGPARFRVEPAGRGPQRLDPPAALLAASARGDLADLRLRDAAGTEVPYLLVPPEAAAPRWAQAERIRPIPATKTESGAELDLGAVRSVDGLEVDFERGGFLKRVRLEGSADGVRWTRLLDDDVLYDLPAGAACAGARCSGGEIPLSRRTLRFAPTPIRALRLVLDDRRTARLPPPRSARARLAPEAAPARGLSVPLAVERREGEPGTSRFALRLPGPHLPVAAVELEVEAPRLSRPARVLEARLAGGRLSPVELGRAGLVRVEQDGVTVSDLRIPVTPPEETELELVVEDGDNPPLALRAAAAELAPRPWIFFESPEGAPVTAELGDPALRAPSYDLEALRPTLPRLRCAAATALALPGGPATAVATPDLAGTTAPGAPVDPAAFRHARAIPAAPAGLAAVRLDAAVLAGCGDLGELRLRCADGRQLPYLLEERDEPLIVPLPLARAEPGALGHRLAAPGLTVYRLDLPERAYPEGRLVLSTDARVFTREVRVLAVPRERAGAPRPLATASWAHADPARPAGALSLALPPLRASALLVAIDDGDNAPLPIGPPRLLLRSYRLRFVHPGPALELLYGSDTVGAPRYDLALLAPRLRAAPAPEVALAPVAAGGAVADGSEARTRLVFYAALGVAVVGLLALVGRLLARAGRPAG
jgi:hypothetical protein